ncbi:hypothetical protein [Streptomyces broussonetiae]|uniref:Uncharacterized protein n=1 Tax=Streptomyces broussonetiae TaxID=2686304 RepID=A0ABV5E5G4_9ACTN
MPITRQRPTGDRIAAAARSAGRAGGYCWVEHPGGGSHCTLSPEHRGRHFNFYTRKEFD